MKFKRTAAAVLAAMTAVSAASVCAFAEENKVELTTLDWSDVHGMTNVANLGDGYFLYQDDNNVIRGIIHVEKNDKGELTYTDVDTDVDLSKNLISANYGIGEYFQLYETDAEGNATKRYVMHLDKSANKVTTVGIYSGDYLYTNENGYSTSYERNDETKTLTIKVITPTGETKSSSLTYDGTDEWWWYLTFLKSGDTLGYVIWQTNSGIFEDTEWNAYSYDIYKIDKNGKLTKIHHADDAYSYGYAGAGENFYCAMEQRIATAVRHYVVREDGSIVDIYDGAGQLQGTEGTLAVRYINEVNNDMAIAQCYYPPLSDSEEYVYALLDLDQLSKSNSTEKVNLKTYQGIYTQDDGKTYLVESMDEKWGFLDADGNEIGEWFDDAGAFIGDYAPVVKDGKAYLVDRNFNRVSEMIDANEVETYSDDMFLFANGDEVKFVTYNKTASAPADTSKPDDTSKPSAEKDNPETGAKGVALTFGLAAIAGAAAVVYRKKK